MMAVQMLRFVGGEVVDIRRVVFCVVGTLVEVFGQVLGRASPKNPTQKGVSLVHTRDTSHVDCLKVRLLRRIISKNECTTLIGGSENPFIIYMSLCTQKYFNMPSLSFSCPFCSGTSSTILIMGHA